MSLQPPAYGTAPMAAFSLDGPAPARRRRHDRRPVAVATRIAGMDCVLDPSGALYWPAQGALVVSDLHLETGSSYARTGQMLPPYDTAVTLARLADAVARYRPERVIALGDSFHDPYGAERLGEADRALLSSIVASAGFVWITGNHDHDGPGALGGTTCAEFTLGGVTFRHIPEAGTPRSPEVAGHLHPAARVAVRGRRVKRRCFVGCERRLVMPAMGCLTGGLLVTDAAFAPLWPEGPGPRLHLLGRERVCSL